MADITILKPFILSWEGGFSNNPNDSGGATMKGITLRTFQSVYGNDKTVSDLKRITDEQWQHIFKKYYWDKWKADEIECQAVANILVDWIWMSGITSIKSIQRALKLKDDGIVGPKTLSLINSMHPYKMFLIILEERRKYIEKISKGKNKVFKKGWLNRLNSIQYNKLILSNKKIIKW